MNPAHFVYLLRSLKNPHLSYIGYTTNLEQRLECHNSGDSVFTANSRPWELISFIGFKNKSQALDFEKYLKSHTGRAFIAKRLWLILHNSIQQI